MRARDAPSSAPHSSPSCAPSPFAPWRARCVVKKAQDGYLVFPNLVDAWCATERDDTDARVAVGRVCAVYCVFDGHKDDTATAYLERHLGRNLEHEFRMLEARTRSGEEARGREGNGEDGEDTVERAMRRAILRTESEYGMSNATGCFFCHGPAPEGGSTVNVVAIQRVVSGRGDDALAFDAVTANVGDSAALMLPHPSEFGAISAEDRDKHVRLSRDHNPVDPFEARRLIQTECRLARLRGNAGEELGPLRVFPGGYAVSRAFGDFDCAALICEPEFTRVRIPAAGCRLLIASDGVFSALKDGEIARECMEYMGSDTCADGIVEKVLKVRGIHDDITATCVDIPSLGELEERLRVIEPVIGEVHSYTRTEKKREPLTREQLLEIEEANADCPDVTVHQGRNFGNFASKKVYDDLEVGDLIGRGIYGSVRRAVDRKTGDILAVKSILRTKVDENAIKDECDALQVLCGHHPNFPSKLMVYEDSPLLKSEVTHIVTDIYTGGTLIQAIAQRGLFDEGDWCVFANQLLGAVSFMHSLGVAHRDLKPDNIMLKEPWSPKPGAIPTLKIIDFGSTTFCLAHETMKGHVGTKFFSAPEVLRRKPYTKKCDVWSVGVLLMVLLKGYPSGTAVEGQWRALQQGLSPTFPDTVPKHFIKLIKAALVMDPTRRPSCGSILKAADDWLGASFTNNNVFTSPNKVRPAKRLAIPTSFSDALSLHIELTRASTASQEVEQRDHEEEDVSVYKGNSWELDLAMEKGSIAKGEPLNVIDNLDEQSRRMAYQKHVTDMLSVVATPMEVHRILQYINQQLRAKNAGVKRTSLDGDHDSIDVELAWCSADLLEEAARENDALEPLTQLELARRLTGLDGDSLSIDLSILNGLDALHERHKHVFNALAKHSPTKLSNSSSPVKLNADELSSVDDGRVLVQSSAHAEMVRAMLSRGLSSHDLSSMSKIPVEPSELTVRGGSAWFLEDWSNSGSSLPKINPAYDSSTRLDKSAILAESESDNA